MKHIVNYTEFENVNEKLKLFGKNSITDIAWNILTLGQSKKIMSQLNSWFGISSNLIRSKSMRLSRILSDTINLYEVEKSKVMADIYANSDDIFKQVEDFVSNSNITDETLSENLIDILFKYEILNRELTFDKITTDIVSRIKTYISQIESNEEYAHVLKRDLELLLIHLDKNVKILESRKRTQMLPAHKLKNLALDVSKIINSKNKPEQKQQLTYLWQKSKNNVYHKYKDYFDIDTIDNWLDLNNYKIKHIDKSLEDVYRELPNAIAKLNQNYEAGSFNTVDTLDDFNFARTEEFYMFRTSVVPKHYMIFYYHGKLKDGTLVLVSFGTYKFNRRDLLVKFSNYDIKYTALNDYPHIFYYIPNLKSFIIEQYSASLDLINISIHESKGLQAKMDDTVSLRSSSPSKYKSYASKYIAKILWKKDSFKTAILSEIHKEYMRTQLNLDNYYDAIEYNFEKAWSIIKKNTLEHLGWKSTMDTAEATEIILKHENN